MCKVSIRTLQAIFYYSNEKGSRPVAYLLVTDGYQCFHGHANIILIGSGEAVLAFSSPQNSTQDRKNNTRFFNSEQICVHV